MRQVTLVPLDAADSDAVTLIPVDQPSISQSVLSPAGGLTVPQGFTAGVAVNQNLDKPTPRRYQVQAPAPEKGTLGRVADMVMLPVDAAKAWGRGLADVVLPAEAANNIDESWLFRQRESQGPITRQITDTIAGIPRDVTRGLQAAYHHGGMKMTGLGMAADGARGARQRLEEVWQDYDLTKVQPATLAEYHRQKADVEALEAESSQKMNILKDMHKENQQNMVQALGKDQRGTEFNKVLRSTIPSISDSLISMGLSVVAGPAVGAGWMGGGVAATTYGNDLSMGIDQDKAAKNALAQGGFEMLYEHLPMKYLGKVFTGASKFLPGMLKAAATEQVTEAMTTPSQAWSQRYFTGTTGREVDGKPEPGTPEAYFSGEEKDPQTGKPAIIQDQIETFKQTLMQSFVMFGMGKVATGVRKQSGGETLGEREKWTDQQYEEFGEFTGNLAASAVLQQQGRPVGKVAVPDWIAVQYPQQTVAILKQFQQQHGFVPEVATKSAVVQQGFDSAHPAAQPTDPAQPTAQPAAPQQPAGPDMQPGSQAEYEAMLAAQEAAQQEDDIPQFTPPPAPPQQAADLPGAETVTAPSVVAGPAPAEVGTLTKAAQVLNPYQQMVSQPYAQAPDQPVMPVIPEVRGAGAGLNTLQAPGEQEQAVAWMQQQLADPATSKFERDALVGMSKSPGQVELIRYWRGFQNRTQQPRFTPAQGGLTSPAPLVARDSAPPVTVPAVPEPAAVAPPSATAAGEGQEAVIAKVDAKITNLLNLIKKGRKTPQEALDLLYAMPEYQQLSAESVQVGDMQFGVDSDSRILTAFEQASQAQPSKGQDTRRQVDPARDDLITAIGKLGGMNTAQVEQQWGKTIADTVVSLRDYASKQGAGYLHPINSKGKPIDRIRELLEQYGYLPPGSDPNALLEKINRQLGGKPQYSNQNQQQVAEQDLSAPPEGYEDYPFSLEGINFPEKNKKHVEFLRRKLAEAKHPNDQRRYRKTLRAYLEKIKGEQAAVPVKANEPNPVYTVLNDKITSLIDAINTGKHTAASAFQDLRANPWYDEAATYQAEVEGNDLESEVYAQFEAAEQDQAATVPAEAALPETPLQPAKQPWEMTHKEEVEAQGGKWPSDSNQQARLLTGARAQERKVLIQQAIADGKPVPSEVLADYPDLQQTSGPVSETTPAVTLAPDAKTAESEVQNTPPTATRNSKGNIELKFATRPDDGTIERLTAAGFKFNQRQKVWYAGDAAEAVKLAEELAGGTLEAAAPEEATAQPESDTTGPVPMLLGEKIGGARKDLETTGGTKPKKTASTIPAWRRRYAVAQISNRDSKHFEKWSILDDTTGRPLVRKFFDTSAEAEALLPLAVFGVKHRVRKGSDGTWGIVRDVTDRKRVTLKDGFETEEEAMRYVTQHAVELIEQSTYFGEEIIARPETVRREGPQYRTGDATAKMFMDTFGFRSAEFGNWNNEAERREILNYAFDSLMDAAELLNIPPKAISLNGELSIAFGARGQGLSGAAAHYEPSYAVINLTKMAGAGHLFHEWLHAMDNYFARQDGRAKSEKVTNKRGDLVYPAKKEDMVSDGFRAKGSGVRQEVQDAFLNLMETIWYKTEQYVEDAEKAQRFVQNALDNVSSQLADIRRNLATERRYGAKKKPATTEQLDRFDALAAKLQDPAGDPVEWRHGIGLDPNKPVQRGNMGQNRWTNDTLEELGALIKAVTGRSGFQAEGKGDMNYLASRVRDLHNRNSMLQEAQNRDTKTKKIPTTFRQEAYKIDQGRTSDYWTEKWEMLARAGSAYIEDKLQSLDRRNDFLSFGSDNKYYRLFNIRPFPEGQERDSINAAFDNLFATLKTKETDKGVALFAKGNESARGLDVADVNQAVAAIVRTFPGSPQVTVVKDFAALPEAVKAEAVKQEMGESFPGVLKGKEAFVVAGNLDSLAHLEEVLLHEIMGHYSIKQLYGGRELSKLNALFAEMGGMPGLLKLAKQNNWDTVAEYARGFAKAEYSLETRKALLVHELLAHTAQIKRAPLLRKAMEYIGAIKDWLRRHGFKHLPDLSSSDLAYILKQARSVMTSPADMSGTHFMAKGAGNETNVSSDRRTEIDRGDGRTVPTTDAGTAADNQTARGMAEGQADQAVITPEETAEYREIEARYFNPDGTEKPGARLAPNGKRSNLNKRQWIQVRTASFKKWFGDWEALSQQQLIKNLKAVELTGKEIADFIEPLDMPALRKKATNHIANLRSRVFNKSLGVDIEIRKNGVKQTLEHGSGPDKIQSIAALDALLENGISVYHGPSTNPEQTSYVVAHPLTIGGNKFMVSLEVKEDQNGRLFYDHEMIKIEALNEVTPQSGVTTEQQPSAPRKGLLNQYTKSVFAVNPDSVSKVVDENGEPLVVYHGTEKGGFSSFRTSRKSKVEGAYFFSDNRDLAKTYSGLGNEIKIEDPDEYGEIDEQRGIYSSFLNIRNEHIYDFGGANWDGQLEEPHYELLDEDGDIIDTVYSYEEAQEALDEGRAADYQEVNEIFATTDTEVRDAQRYGNDGAILYDVKDPGPQSYAGDEAGTVYVVFDETNIKSATQNTGAFDGNNPDIRFSLNDASESFTGLQADAIRKVLPWAEVVQAADQVPEKVLADAARMGVKPWNIEGFLHDGKVWLVAENIRTLSRARQLALGHELAHLGQDEQLVDLAVDWFKSTADAQDNAFKKVAHQILQEEADKRKLDLTKPEQYRKAVTEATARLAEDMAAKGVKPGLIQKIVNHLRVLLRKSDIRLKVTDKELAGAVAEMLRLGEKRLSKLQGSGTIKEKGTDSAKRIEKIKEGLYVPERLPDSYEREGQKGTLGAVSNVSRAVHSAVQRGRITGESLFERTRRYKDLAENHIKPQEEAALREWAQANNMMLDRAEFDAAWIAQGKPGRAEHDVYFTADKKHVIKRNRLSFHDTYLDYFHRLAAHNTEFSNVPYELIGFMDVDGALWPVVKQPAVAGRPSTWPEAHKEMLDSKYIPIGTSKTPTSYHVPGTGMIVRDVSGDNSRINKHDTIYVIDPVFDHDIETADERLMAEAGLDALPPAKEVRQERPDFSDIDDQLDAWDKTTEFSLNATPTGDKTYLYGYNGDTRTFDERIQIPRYFRDYLAGTWTDTDMLRQIGLPITAEEADILREAGVGKGVYASTAGGDVAPVELKYPFRFRPTYLASMNKYLHPDNLPGYLNLNNLIDNVPGALRERLADAFTQSEDSTYFSLRSRVAETVQAIPWDEVLPNTRNEWLRTINPLDWSRSYQLFQDWTPESIKSAFGFVGGNPEFQAERHPGMQPFVRAGEGREITRMQIMLDFLGYQPGATDTRSTTKRITDFFTKWDNTQSNTDWEKLNQRLFGLTDKQRQAFDLLFVEGDAMGSEYTSLGIAKMNPRIRAIVDQTSFDLYRDVRRHLDGTVKDARLKWMEQLMMQIPDMSDKEREKHISELRNRIANVRGWMPRDHGEGRYQAAVYHVFTAEEMSEDWQTTTLYDKDGEVSGEQFFLPYFPGNEAMEAIESRIKQGWQEAEAKVTTTAKGHVVITVRGNDTSDVLDAINEAIAGSVKNWKPKQLLDKAGKPSGTKFVLTYHPGDMVMKIIQERIAAGWPDTTAAVAITQKGSIEITLIGNEESAMHDIRSAIDGHMNHVQIRVMSYMRRFGSIGSAKRHAEEVQKNYKKAMPRNYIEGHRYITKTTTTADLTEDVFQAMKGDMALEAALKQGLKNALKRGEIDRAEYETLEQQLIQDTTEVLLSRAAGRYQIRRAPFLIEGYETEESMSLFQDYMMGTAGMLSKAAYAMQQYKNMETVGNELRPWATRYVFDSLRNMGLGDRISGDIRAFASLWYLGFRVSSALINSTQPYTQGVSELGRRTGGEKSAIRLIAKAQANIIKGKLSNEEKQIFDTAVYKVQEMQTALGELSGHGEGTRAKAGKLLHAMTGKALAVFQNVEVMNRKSVILASYRAFRNPDLPTGMIDEQALEKAMDVNRKVNYEMGRHNLPGWARSAAGRTFYSLQSFTWNTLNWGFNRLTSGEKRDQIALLRFAGMIALLGGAAALPGGDELDKLYRRLRGKSLKVDFQNWSSTQAKKYGTLAETANAFAWHGLLSAGGYGVNASNAMRLQMPIMSDLLNDESLTESLSGIPGALAQKGKMTATYAGRGDYWKATESAAPEVVAGAMRAYRMKTDGATTARGKAVFDEQGQPLKYSTTDAIKRGLGFQPYGQSKRSELTQQMRNIQKHWTQERGDLMDDLHKSSRDREKFNKMLKQVTEFNAKLAQSQAAGLVNPITNDTIRRRLQQRPDKKGLTWKQQHAN